MEYIPTLFKSIELKCPILSPVYYPNGITETQALKHAIIPKEPSKCDICGSEEGPRLAQVFSTMISNTARRRLHPLKLVLVIPFTLVFVSTMQVCSQSR